MNGRIDAESSKYRNFSAAIDKALKAFETSTEWADLISCLQKLNKVLESHGHQVKCIPRSIILCRRLALCLNPKLPSGVHLKALETCRLIFEILGPSLLAQELHLYSIGLFPLFALASINVRKEMLRLLEKYLLPLDLSLRPSAPALLTGVLPALEEGTQFFIVTNEFLEKVQKSLGSQYFYECIWHCVKNCPGVRLPALTFVINHVDKSKPMDDQLYIMGCTVSLMVSAMCCAASDSVQLVQRNLLELVTSTFPLHCEHLVREDLSRIVQSAMTVVLKRDMSLNRRLFSWFFGHPVSAANKTLPDMEYLRRVTLPLIETGVGRILDQGTCGEEVALVCRLLMHMLDRDDLGPVVVDVCLMPLLIHAHARYNHVDSKEGELVRNMVDLLATNSLDVAFVWNYLAQAVQNMQYDENSIETTYGVLVWCLHAIKLDSHVDIRSKHLPSLLLTCLTQLFTNVHRVIRLKSLTIIMDSMRQMLDEIMMTELTKKGGIDDLEHSTEVTENSTFHVSEIGDEGRTLVCECVQKYTEVVDVSLNRLLDHCELDPCRIKLITSLFDLLTRFSEFPLNSINHTKITDSGWLIAVQKLCLGKWSKDLEGSSACELVALSGLIKIMAWCKETHKCSLISDHQIHTMESDGFLKDAAAALWNKLDYGRRNEEEKITELLLMLHTLHPGYSSPTEDLIVQSLTSLNQEVRLGGMKKLQVLWSLNRQKDLSELWAGGSVKWLNRAVLTVVDLVTSCENHFDPVHDLARVWLSSSVSSVITLMCSLLLHPSTCRVSIQYLNVMQPSTRRPHNLISLTTKSLSPIYHLDDMRPCGDHNSVAEKTRLLSLRHELMLCNDYNTLYNTLANGSEESPMRETLRFDEDESDEVVVATVVDQLVKMVCDLREEQEEDELLTDSSPDSAFNPIINVDYELDERLCVNLIEGAVEMGAEVDPLGLGDHSPDSPSLHHPFHAHMLLYTEGSAADLIRAARVMRSMSELLSLNGGELAGVIVDTLARSSTNATPRSAQVDKLVECMAAHLSAITGKCYWEGVVNDGKSYMLLEVVVTVCLYFLRSYHVNNPCLPVTLRHLRENVTAKLAACDLLNLLLANVTSLVVHRELATFVSELMSKCRLQKTLLHCVMATLPTETPIRPLSLSVHEFNGHGALGPLTESLQSRLLDVLVHVFQLECKISQCVSAESLPNASGILVDKLSVAAQLPSVHNVPLVDSSLFIITALNALKTSVSGHEVWLRMLCRSLPYVRRSLAEMSQHVCHQLCHNAEECVSQCYSRETCDVDYPTNYLCTVIESLTAIVHHCVLSPAIVESLCPESPARPVSSMASQVKEGTSLILTNLMRAFTFADPPLIDGSPVKVRDGVDGLAKAKGALLTHFPHILSPLCRIWTNLSSDKSPNCPVGSPQQCRKLILDLLSPVAVSHPSYFLSALGIVWLTRRNMDDSFNDYSSDQMDMADLLMSLKLLRFESLTLAVSHTLKDPAKLSGVKDRDIFPIGLSLLELVDACLLVTPDCVLVQSWTSLHELLMQVLPKAEENPRVALLLYKIYSGYVLICCKEGVPFDSNGVKYLQEACAKLTESLTTIIGGQLQKATWLKPTLVIKSQPQSPEEHSTSNSTLPSPETSDPPSEITSKVSRDKRNAHLSGQAMQLLQKNLATVLDYVFGSDDKDKLQPILQTLWNTMAPFFKSRTHANGGNFTVCSGLLASLSEYSVTRSVWRKGALDILCESNFFRMNDASGKYWLTIVDNLMTNDKQTFPELLRRISPTQSAGFLTSKEQEYEQRSLSLKRLTFTLLSSQLDQYYMYLHDVQDRVTDNLKMYTVAPHVHAHVMLCLRVLLIRLSPQYFGKMWPTIMTELMQVLGRMESKLRGHVENDYKHAREDQWMCLYVSALKLVVSFFLVPSEYLASFQMYSWSLVGCVPWEGAHPANVFTPLLHSVVQLLGGSKPSGAPVPDCVSLLRVGKVGQMRSLLPALTQLINREQPCFTKEQAFSLIWESVLCDLIDEFV